MAEKNGFSPPFNWNDEKIYFASTKEEKIKEIGIKKCSFYIDDLPEIIKALSPLTKGILYDPKNQNSSENCIKMSHWEQLSEILY